MRLLAAVAALVAGALLLLIPRFVFPACEYLGRGRMHCTAAAHGEFVVGGLLVAAGAALLLLQGRRAPRSPPRRARSLLCAAAFFVPAVHPLLRQPRHGLPLRHGAERPVHRRRRRASSRSRRWSGCAREATRREA